MCRMRSRYLQTRLQSFGSYICVVEFEEKGYGFDV